MKLLNYFLYICVGCSTGPDEWKAWIDPWYWVYKDPTNEQLMDERDQFYKIAEHLATSYKGRGLPNNKKGNKKPKEEIN